MKFGLRLSPGARHDLNQLRRYIRKSSSSAVAARYVGDLVAYTEGLQTFPHRGTLRDELHEDVRVIGFRGRVSIHFSVTENQVTILAYTYAGRNWSDDYQ